MNKEQLRERARKLANELEENQTLGVYDRDEDLEYDKGYNSGEVSGYEDGYIAGYEDCDEWHKQSKEHIYNAIDGLTYFLCLMNSGKVYTAYGIKAMNGLGQLAPFLKFDHKIEEYDGIEEAVKNIKYWKEYNLPED